MELKCIKCQNEANYIVNGDSLCCDHVPTEIRMNWVIPESKTRITPDLTKER